MSEVIKTYVQKEATDLFTKVYNSPPETEIELRSQDEFFAGIKIGLSSGIELAKEIIMEITGCNEKRATELFELFIKQKEGK